MKQAGFTFGRSTSPKGWFSKKEAGTFPSFGDLQFIIKFDAIMKEVQDKKAVIICSDESFARTSDVYTHSWMRKGNKIANWAVKTKG